MGLFEWYLTIWVALCIVAGLFLGNLFPQALQVFASLEIAHVNISVAIILIAIPLLLQTYGIFTIAYGAAKAIKLPHNIAASVCMIGT